MIRKKALKTLYKKDQTRSVLSGCQTKTPASSSLRSPWHTYSPELQTTSQTFRQVGASENYPCFSLTSVEMHWHWHGIGVKSSLSLTAAGKCLSRFRHDTCILSTATIQQNYDSSTPPIPFPLVYWDRMPSGRGSVLHAFNCGLMLDETTAASNCCGCIQI